MRPDLEIGRTKDGELLHNLYQKPGEEIYIRPTGGRSADRQCVRWTGPTGDTIAFRHLLHAEVWAAHMKKQNAQ